MVVVDGPEFVVVIELEEVREVEDTELAIIVVLVPDCGVVVLADAPAVVDCVGVTVPPEVIELVMAAAVVVVVVAAVSVVVVLPEVVGVVRDISVLVTAVPPIVVDVVGWVVSGLVVLIE